MGVNLYNLQQELARHQMLLEKEHDHFGEINQDRQRIEQELKQIRDKHSMKKEDVDAQLRQSRSRYFSEREKRTKLGFLFIKHWIHKRNEMFFNVDYNI